MVSKIMNVTNLSDSAAVSIMMMMVVVVMQGAAIAARSMQGWASSLLLTI